MIERQKWCTNHNGWSISNMMRAIPDYDGKRRLKYEIHENIERVHHYIISHKIPYSSQHHYPPYYQHPSPSLIGQSPYHVISPEPLIGQPSYSVWVNMVARSQLAVMDHNSSLGLKHYKTKKGEKRFMLTFSKVTQTWITKPNKKKKDKEMEIPILIIEDEVFYLRLSE